MKGNEKVLKRTLPPPDGIDAYSIIILALFYTHVCLHAHQEDR